MNKRTTLFFTFLSIFSFYSPAQSTLILQPGPNAGKDAIINELSSQRNVNYASNVQLAAHSGTNSGIPFIVRGLFHFDLTAIPQGMQIDSAYLSLYSVDANYGLFFHRNTGGPNNALVKRVTSPWSEATVTWNNAPLTTSTNQVTLAPSTSQMQDYLNTNVTSVIQDIYSSPTNYGMQILQQIESGFRSLIFFSSDATDSLKRPKLVVHYSSISTSIDDVRVNNSEFNVFPNPTNGISYIEFNNQPNLNLSIIDVTGKEVASISNYKNLEQIDLSNYAKGIYFIRATNGSYTASKKLIITN